MQQSEKQRRIDALMARLRPIMEELTRLDPPDVLTVLLVLPVDLAGYMSEVAQRQGVELPHIYASAALHGLWHSATEHGEAAQARQVARMIRRLSDEQTWATFRARHPEAESELESEVRDGL